MPKNSICPQTNNRHDKHRKQEKEERTKKSKPSAQKQAPGKNPRINRLDKRETHPPGTDTYRIWRAKKRTKTELHLHRKGKSKRPDENSVSKEQSAAYRKADIRERLGKKQSDYKKQPTRTTCDLYGTTNANSERIQNP